MSSMPTEELTEETGKQIKKLFEGDTVGMRYPGVTSTSNNYLSQFLRRVLSELDINFLTDLVLILIKELISNATKANAKRIYFEKLNLNIENTEEYKKGLETYTEEVLGNWEIFSRDNIDAPYYIKIGFKLLSNELLILVENNVEIMPQEYERIKKRIDFYKKNKNIDSAINEIRDDTEGAGLGIVLTMVLLQNAGIPAENYEIASGKGITRCLLKVPKSITPPKIKEEIKDKILSEVDKLPSFPETISMLVALCSSENSSLKQIADTIQKDPSLTAQVLRIASSAGYMQSNKNLSLLESVKVIGLKVIKNLLMVIGAREAMSKTYNNKELVSIFEDSNRIAFIATNLAKKPAIQEIIGVTGLVHQLGKIVLLSLDSKVIEDIHKMVKALTPDDELKNLAMIEEIAIGISHPEIGALLAAKWKFPEAMITAIRFQEKPMSCPDPFKEIVHTLYLAIRINEAFNEPDNYLSIEQEVLKAFSLDTIKDYDKFVENMKVKYAQSREEEKKASK
ncbi:MAG: HDOD domain-containing protein [Spirochaetia bacterium]|nr:HDOD domain-containing protein [Spirochaetia bacterium]